MKRKFSVFGALMIAVSIMLSACGGESFTEDDAKMMVKAELDARFYGDFKAAEEVFGETETSQQYYDEMMEEEVNYIKDSVGGSDVYDEDWLSLMQKAFKGVKYEIKGVANEDENTWIVTVGVTPLMFEDMISDAVREEIVLEELEKLDEQTVSEIQSDEDKLMDWSSELTIRLLNEALNQPVYGDERTIDIKVAMTDGAWSVDGDSLSMFADNAIM